MIMSNNSRPTIVELGTLAQLTEDRNKAIGKPSDGDKFNGKVLYTVSVS